MVGKETKKNLKNLNFSDNDINKLTLFCSEVLKYNKKFNLISKSTEKLIWTRHIIDSAQIVKFINFKESGSLADLGTGAGFPGIILSIFCTTFQFKWDTISFLLLSIFHPFYIIIFSTVAPFKRVIWK